MKKCNYSQIMDIQLANMNSQRIMNRVSNDCSVNSKGQQMENFCYNQIGVK